MIIIELMGGAKNIDRSILDPTEIGVGWNWIKFCPRLK
jgi:hypothetical protein